jgi:hypothetical protein
LSGAQDGCAKLRIFVVWLRVPSELQVSLEVNLQVGLQVGFSLEVSFTDQCGGAALGFVFPSL